MLIRAAILTQIIVLATTATFQVPSNSNDHKTIATSTAPTVVEAAGIHGADEAMTQQIHDAINRYANAGLELPELRIHVHNTQEPCKDNMGLYNKGGDQHRIDICERYPNVIMHELAHAWEYHNLDDTTRQAYLDLADLDTWNDKAIVSNARGVEQVAHIISWGIEDKAIQATLLGHHHQDLERFELLTGMTSPRIAHLTTTTDTPAPTMIAIDATDLIVNSDFQ